MSCIHKAIIRGYSAPRRHRANEPLPVFTIRLHQGGGIIRGLSILNDHDGARDLTVLKADQRKGQMGNLVSPGYVEFQTRAGKKWPVRYPEFSFVINGRELDNSQDPKPQRRVYESPKADHDVPPVAPAIVEEASLIERAVAIAAAIEKEAA